MAFLVCLLFRESIGVAMPLTSLSPIPLKNVEFRDGMGLRLVNGIPCLSAFSGVDRGGHH